MNSISSTSSAPLRIDGLVLALSLSLAALSQGATTFVTNLIFDAYSDLLDTSGLVGPSSKVLKAFPEPMPSSQTVTTILTGGSTAGATRVATLMHLDPAIVSGVTKGNSSAIIFNNQLGFGTDTHSPSKLTLAYDFTTMPGGSAIDVLSGNDHLVISVFDTDGGDNNASARLTFEDANSMQVTEDLANLGVDIGIKGEHYIPFTDFPAIDFEHVTNVELVWESTGIGQFDGVLAFAGAGIFVGVPEPGFAFPLLAVALLGVLGRGRKRTAAIL